MPPYALDLLGKARLNSHGRVDGRLVERVAVEAGDAADGHGGVAEVAVEVGKLGSKLGEGGEGGDPGVFAPAFEAVEALDLVRGVVEGVVGMGEEELRGVVVGYADGPFGVVAVGGDVEGLIGATDRMDEDASKQSLQHEGIDVVPVVALVFHIRLGEIDYLHDSGRARVQQLVQHFESSAVGMLFISF